VGNGHDQLIIDNRHSGWRGRFTELEYLILNHPDHPISTTRVVSPPAIALFFLPPAACRDVIAPIRQLEYLILNHLRDFFPPQ
jgi:hypothetical protein